MKVFYIDLKDIDNKRELHEKIADALALPEETRRRVLWENAVKLYGLPLPLLP